MYVQSHLTDQTVYVQSHLTDQTVYVQSHLTDQTVYVQSHLILCCCIDINQFFHTEDQIA